MASHNPLATPGARWRAQLETGATRLLHTTAWSANGRATRATGLIIEATGLKLAVGAACKIEIAPGLDRWADAEVVGFHGPTLYLMPQGDISGLPPGARVVPVEPAVQDPTALPVFGNDAPPVPPQPQHLPVGDTPKGRAPCRVRLCQYV